MNTLAELEIRRLALQRDCDSAKTQQERNRLGQFATPPALASEIMRLADKLLPARQKVRFLDPAFGTGSFFSALLRTFTPNRLSQATAFEVDRHYADKALDLWLDSKLDLRIADFTKAVLPKTNEQFNLIVCNPPYVRHHHLPSDEKARLQKLTGSLSGMRLSGLAGLYCYFLLISDAWASHDGICIWLIPSEFMDVNYGAFLKEYLLTKVTLLQIHRFDSADVQFGDALVSSSVVCFRKAQPTRGHVADFTFGGSLNEPKVLQRIPVAELRAKSKWNGRSSHTETSVPSTRLSDLFDIKRGLATGGNRFFILTPEKIREHHLPMKFFKPILPSPRYFSVDEIHADEDGYPKLDRQLFLLDCSLPEEEVRREHPSLWKYLNQGKHDVAKGYLCRSRSPWYSQENRPAPLFLCTYMGRNSRKNGAPFRFILNHSKATGANVYLMMYPKRELDEALRRETELPRKIWTWLNEISPEVVLGQGRVYGGGLYKVEPRELGNVPADNIAKHLGITPKKKVIQLEFLAMDERSQNLEFAI